MIGHGIELSLETDSGVSAKFVCEEPADGWCHQACAVGCEESDDECIAEHPREQTEYCNPIEWVDNGGMWWETYVGEETEPHSGSIVFEWQGDWYGWRYEDVKFQERPPLSPTAASDKPWVNPSTYETVGPQPGFLHRWFKRVCAGLAGARP